VIRQSIQSPLQIDEKKALVSRGSGQDSAWTLGSDETVTEVTDPGRHSGAKVAVTAKLSTLAHLEIG
jgi:hypothetical protein